MNKITKILILMVTTGLIGACTSYNPHGYMNYQSYTWEGEPLYPESYDGNYGYQQHQQYQREKRQVVVPETYHVGSMHSPTRASDRDRNWVHRQNPGNYTIEVAEGEKASQVAGKLHKAPKANRKAQVKSLRNGKTVYKGFYGTYNNYEDAKKALNALPQDVRQGADIKSWGSVQGSAN